MALFQRILNNNRTWHAQNVLSRFGRLSSGKLVCDLEYDQNILISLYFLVHKEDWFYMCYIILFIFTQLAWGVTNTSTGTVEKSKAVCVIYISFLPIINL